MQVNESTVVQGTEDSITAVIEGHRATIEELANQAADAGLYGLQDACLLIVETLAELMGTESPELTEALHQSLQTFPNWVVAYLQNEPNAVDNIAQVLVHPDLQLPLSEEEFLMLKQTLSDDISVGMAACIDDETTENTLPDRLDVVEMSVDEGDNQSTLTQHLAIIEQCADEAADSGQYGLQDVCLLIVDTLSERKSELISPALLSVLDKLPPLMVAYRQEPVAATDHILALLRHPELDVPLADEEVAMLRALLLPETPVDSVAIPALAEHENAECEGDTDTPAIGFHVELVDLLLREAHLIREQLEALVIDASIGAQLSRLEDELERYGTAATFAGFTGLTQICQHVRANIQHFAQHAGMFTTEHHQLLQDWVAQVSLYLDAFAEENAGLALIAQLSDTHWPIALTPEQAVAILQQLRVVHSVSESTDKTERQQWATDEDVFLALPEDVNQELLDILLQELPAYTQEFSEAIRHLEHGGNTEDIDVAQRIAHTLKGSANTVGIGGIAVLTHNLEDILEACAKAHQLPNKALVGVLIDAADCLEAMSDFLIGQGESQPAEARQVLQEVLDWANQIDQHGLPGNDDRTGNDSGVDEVHFREQEAQIIINEPETVTHNQQANVIRVPSEQIDTLLRLSGESLILNSQANERLRRIRTQLVAMDAQFKTLRRLSDELEQLIDIKDLTGQTLSLAKQEFDSLEMDQYNELYTTSRRLVEAAFDAREMNLDAQSELEQMGEVLEYQQRVVIDTQGAIMQTRLVPIASISARLQRTLRQTCRLTGKNAALSLSGEQLLIDSDVLNSLVDPLMHLLRNAIDHGLETEAVRLAAGKPVEGHIAVHFDREGNNILVRCQDDGAGLDFEAIYQTAIKRGVVTADQILTEEELKRLILRPNFSTRTESTQISGRGVGMNAVHFHVLSLGGSLALHSEHGKGLVVELRLPLPISRSLALLALAGTYRVAIASKGVKQILYVSPDDFVTIDAVPMVHLDGVNYPLTSLNTLLRVAETRKKNQSNNTVLLVQQDEKTWAVSLDSLIDSLEIVIKDFGQYIKKIPGYIGAAILGDGAVAPVLDMPELLRLSVGVEYNAIEPVDIVDPKALLPKVLVVDDSLSQRRSLGQLLGDAGFAVYMARDGIEAIETLAELKPDILLTDLEMPRMNGIELTAHIRAQAHMKDLPIIMVTSRTTQKHHKMAEDAGVDFYIAKPVREDDLLARIQYLLEPQ